MQELSPEYVLDFYGKVTKKLSIQFFSKLRLRIMKASNWSARRDELAKQTILVIMAR